MKTIILMMFTFAILNSAERCNISHSPNRSEIHSNQQCLKSELEKSIALGKRYMQYHNDVFEAVNIYYTEHQECSNMYMNYANSPSSLRSNLLDDCVSQLKLSKKELDRLERQYGLLSGDYLIFKGSIENLKSKLFNLKRKYHKILGN